MVATEVKSACDCEEFKRDEEEFVKRMARVYAAPEPCSHAHDAENFRLDHADDACDDLG